jgi:CRISPR-associated protein Csy3
MTTKTDTFAKTPAILSFQRGIIVTDGAFYNLKSGQYEDHPLAVTRHGIRGTQNVSSAADTAKGGTRDPSNIQQTETAKTDHDADGFVVTFGLRMIDLSSALFACAAEKVEITSAVRESVLGFADRAKTSAGAQDVCRRIARNIANGSWLWRNRVSASTIRIDVLNGDTKVAEFDALTVPMRHFDDFTANEIAVADVLQRGMQGDRTASLTVIAFVSFGVAGAYEVFPSQAYVESKPSGFARPLYKINPTRMQTASQASDVESAQVLGQAALRDQKIANRLRTIDTWYPSYDEVKQPIPVEPNGANLDLMQFFRPKKSSAFSMFARLNQIDPDTDEGKFCIAMMLRGGVLGEAGGKEKEKGDAPADPAQTAEAQA